MNKILIFPVCLLLFPILFVNFANADESLYEPTIPDLVLDFSDDKNWYGLKSGETPYWKIENGVGKFNIQPGTLEPGKRQLESASIDLENLLGERIGEDWVLLDSKPYQFSSSSKLITMSGIAMSDSDE